MKTTRADIIKKIADRTGYPSPQIAETISEFMDIISESLIDGNTIELRGFGTFEPRVRKGRTNARNPKTGKIVSVPRHRTAVFRPGKELADELWEQS